MYNDLNRQHDARIRHLALDDARKYLTTTDQDLNGEELGLIVWRDRGLEDFDRETCIQAGWQAVDEKRAQRNARHG